MTMIRISHLLAAAAIAPLVAAAADASQPFQIKVIDKENGWPVPLVELRTTHNVRFVTDNAGVIAFELPELMGKEIWLDLKGHGYEVEADGFGFRGVRMTPNPGDSITVQVNRTNIARRLGRLTGGGLFSESQQLGSELQWTESGVLGCDSVQIARHQGKLYWAWGDTVLPHYPLGIFHMSSATTQLKPLESFTPPISLHFDYFTDEKGTPRGVAKMPGSGPTWVSGYVSLPDQAGKSHLVGTYRKIKPPLDTYEAGLLVWDDEANSFHQLRVLWTKSDDSHKAPSLPEGHPVFWKDERGKNWVLFGDPFPTIRCRANFEAWHDPSQWETLRPQEKLTSADNDRDVRPHRGSIAWNAWREQWVAIFTEIEGDPSFLGEVWYAEADSPFGPWGPAVKVVSHDNYSFYNPRIHPEFTADDSPILLFEGTYTRQFSGAEQPTPRYDYNQILYRLDLDDAALSAAK